MKVLSLALTFTTLSCINACVLDGLEFTESCTVSAIADQGICTQTDLISLLGENYDDRIQMACNEARMLTDKEMLPWDAVTKRGYQFDKEYFNGGKGDI